MPDLQYGLSSYKRTEGNFPELPVINMFVESVPTEEQPVLQSRPGLAVYGSAISGTVGTVKAMYNGDGSNTIYVVTTDNRFYSLSGTTSTFKGSIDGSGPVSFGAYNTNTFINAGQSVWNWDGATLSAVTTPGSFGVTALTVAASHLVVIDGGTGKIFWSDALGTTLPALNFATAEQSPDALLDLLWNGDILVLFGNNSTENWQSTGDATAPFQPIIGRTFPVGIRATGCARLFNRSFAWITDHNRICFGDPTNIISNQGLEEKLTNSTSAYLWTFWYEGMEFLAVRTDTETFVYNSRSELWSQFVTAGSTTWDPIAYAGGVFGSSTVNRYAKWSTTFADSQGALERRFRAGYPITTSNLRIDNVSLRCNTGYGSVTGNVTLKTSRDGGNTWGAARTKTMGAPGSYLTRPTWRSLGAFGFPAFLCEISCTDPIPFRVSAVKVNEPLAGRK